MDKVAGAVTANMPEEAPVLVSFKTQQEKKIGKIIIYWFFAVMIGCFALQGQKCPAVIVW